MNTFEPWQKYPGLAKERLAAIANIICNVRHDVILLHEPNRGDGPWSLGTRAYERICWALRNAACADDWLTILPEAAALAFSFAIGGIPFRFYRGDPEEPPHHYQFRSYGEVHHHQLRLDLGEAPPIDGVLRLAVETDGFGEVSAVTLVEVDSEGHPTGAYEIPLGGSAASTNVLSIQPPPVDLPPVVAEPLKKEENEKKKDDGFSSIS